MYSVDITIIRSYARSLHRSFSTSLDPFKQVQNELALLLAALDTTGPSSSDDETEVYSSMKDGLHECHNNLKHLRRMKIDYDSRDSQQNGDLEDDSIEQLAEIRRQLSYFTMTLNFINTERIRLESTNQVYSPALTVSRSTQEHVIKLLHKYLQDEDSRKKAKTIISSRSISSGERDDWMQLRKEIQATGISPQHFSENLDLIIAIFQRTFKDDMPDLDNITQFMVDTEPVSSAVPEMGRKPASITSNFDQQTVKSVPTRSSSIWQVSPLRVNAIISKILGGRNDLVSCAEDGDLVSVIAKLEEGADINALNENGDSALSLAAARGHKEIVLLLFTKGANVGSMNQQRETALVQAAKHGHDRILNILISHSESIDDYHCQMALGAAAERGHKKIVETLLQIGVDADKLDISDEKANTPLFKAARNGHEDVVRSLLLHGVRTDTFNFWNQTAMFAACQANQKMIALRLFKSGAEFDTKASSVASSGLWVALDDEKDARRSDPSRYRSQTSR